MIKLNHFLLHSSLLQLSNISFLPNLFVHNLPATLQNFLVKEEFPHKIIVNSDTSFSSLLPASQAVLHASDEFLLIFICQMILQQFFYIKKDYFTSTHFYFFFRQQIIERLRLVWMQNAWVCCPSAQSPPRTAVLMASRLVASRPHHIHLQFHDVLGKSSLQEGDQCYTVLGCYVQQQFPLLSRPDEIALGAVPK